MPGGNLQLRNPYSKKGTHLEIQNQDQTEDCISAAYLRVSSRDAVHKKLTRRDCVSTHSPAKTKGIFRDQANEYVSLRLVPSPPCPGDDHLPTEQSKLDRVAVLVLPSRTLETRNRSFRNPNSHREARSPALALTTVDSRLPIFSWPSTGACASPRRQAVPTRSPVLFSPQRTSTIGTYH